MYESYIEANAKTSNKTLLSRLTAKYPEKWRCHLINKALASSPHLSNKALARAYGVGVRCVQIRRQRLNSAQDTTPKRSSKAADADISCVPSSKRAKPRQLSGWQYGCNCDHRRPTAL